MDTVNNFREQVVKGLTAAFPAWSIIGETITSEWNKDRMITIIELSMDETVFKIELCADGDYKVHILCGIYNCKTIEEAIHCIINEIREEKKFHLQMRDYELKCLRRDLAEVREMMTALLYAPGGPRFKEAKTSFESHQN
ncbi:hypothetical protein BNJ_00275 [Kaumoebavirus]|uniref:hypothetical protein n=1 Tax=Kaumoebavirus TaxID=1859492 RepID=UPI0009C38854|nr:hypothetical protein BNJ_00275 [Kaumoebavirus]ARA72099.1 hypothetical protein BNJ_00275 [Kaumoebavirus]